MQANILTQTEPEPARFAIVQTILQESGMYQVELMNTDPLTRDSPDKPVEKCRNCQQEGHRAAGKYPFEAELPTA